MGLLKKIGRGIKKVARKIIPKEVAGIMQVAAPFVAATPAGIPAALALSLGGQLRSGRGRISPLKTLLAIAPSRTFRDFTTGQRAIGGRFGIPTIDLGGTRIADFGSSLDKFLYGAPADLPSGATAGTRRAAQDIFTGAKKTQGLLGVGGEGLSPTGLIEGKLIKPDGENISIARVFGFATAGLSLFDTKEKIKEEGEELGLEPSEIARLQQEAAEAWEDFDTTAFRPKVAQGGLMRVNRKEGNPDPLTPAGIGSLASKKEPPRIIEYYPEDDSRRRKDAFLEVMDEDGNRFTIDLEEYIEKYGQPKLSRKNLALGSRPTEQESGLGGLPIEADMRYTGGFMPYGAKEKADDVPARLSKNEFVFTADAVRGAGGGDINTGAKRMYQSMKQLEQMGKRA